MSANCNDRAVANSLGNETAKKRQDYLYEFSIIMSIYNMEKYMREAIDSVIAQDFGFERVQLILVNDGSKDSSAQICDEYAKAYPENIVAVHKVNGGLSSARNEGLKYAEGRYVNFCDPDDSFSTNVLSKVHEFFSRVEELTDVVSIPVCFFGAYTGEHQLNYKFKDGTRVIDLSEEYDAVQLQVASAFIKNEQAKKLSFDTEIVTAEDGREQIKILADRLTLGVVSDCIYNYRKHSASILANVIHKEKYYIGYLDRFSLWAIDYCKKKLGYVPKFVQYTVMYDLQWHIRQKSIPDGVLTSEEIEIYKQKIGEVLQNIDDDVILGQRHLSNEFFLFCLYSKYKAAGAASAYNHVLSGLDYSQYHPLKLEFIKLSENNARIEGCVTIPVFEKRPEIYADINGEIYPCEVFFRHRETISLDEKIAELWGFSVSLPLDSGAKETKVKFIYCLDGEDISVKHFECGNFSPISTLYENSYCIDFGRKLSFFDEGILIQKSGLADKISSEWKFCRELWNKNLQGGRKAVIARTLYHLLKPFKRKQIWLISDRVVKADDNGEAFFRYLMEHHKGEMKAWFVIDRSSADFKRMQAIGPVVHNLSFKHKLLHLLSDYVISAQADGITVNPFQGYHQGYCDILQKHRFVFLQHGITQNDISSWLNRYNKNFYGFVTSAHAEYDSIVNTESYYYDPSVIWLMGMPRFDRRHYSDNKCITIAPTWRNYLSPSINERTFERQYDEHFLESEYRNTYNKLINDERLITAAKKYGYRIHFAPHPNVMPTISAFDKHPDVEFGSLDDGYNELYAMSSMMITDYSSVVFDFAYLRKPVLYFQFDADKFFSGEHVVTKGYFDYYKNGFGEVEHTIDALVDRIIEYMENDCRLKDKYRERIDAFFAYDDHNNCQRVYDKIMEKARQE